MFQYPANIIRWVDGDTVWIDLDLGFRTHLQVDIRLAEINTPEVVNYTLQGISDQAREFCELMCPPGAAVVVDIGKSDKYGRWLGHIRYLNGSADRQRILLEGKTLNADLIERGLAKPYSGGKR